MSEALSLAGPQPELRYTTREAWMIAFVDRVAPRFELETGTKRPKIRVSIGRTGSKRTLGETWADVSSEDSTREIFIRPTQSDPVRVAGILMHELAHAFLPADVKHKAAFKRLGEAVGLVGKPTEMLPGPILQKELETIVAELGPFPPCGPQHESHHQAADAPPEGVLSNHEL